MVWLLESMEYVVATRAGERQKNAKAIDWAIGLIWQYAKIFFRPYIANANVMRTIRWLRKGNGKEYFPMINPMIASIGLQNGHLEANRYMAKTCVVP